MTSRLLVRTQKKPLHGSVPVPSDRSITHRALILAALSNGPCELRGFGYGSDNLRMLAALGALGVRYEDDGRGTLKLRASAWRGSPLRARRSTVAARRRACGCSRVCSPRRRFRQRSAGIRRSSA